jgi:hypothetical protein
MKNYFLILFLLSAGALFSQQDTTERHGTIRIGKPKQDEVFIKVISRFDQYDLIGLKKTPVEKPFQPFPVVDGYAYPFNYTKYFRDKFKVLGVNMNGKKADTVVLEVKVLENGKVYIRDKSKIMMIKGQAAVYNEQEGAYEINILHLDCMNILKQIKKWFPAYVILPKKDKFRDQTVIKPDKRNVDATGTITVIFSTTPLED